MLLIIQDIFFFVFRRQKYYVIKRYSLRSINHVNDVSQAHDKIILSIMWNIILKQLAGNNDVFTDKLLKFFTL
jgi:hypothetical protein